MTQLLLGQVYHFSVTLSPHGYQPVTQIQCSLIVIFLHLPKPSPLLIFQNKLKANGITYLIFQL